jgi:hypothetical protein
MLFDYEPTGGVVRMNCELLLFDMRKVFLTNEKLTIHIMKGTKIFKKYIEKTIDIICVVYV